MNPTQCVKLSAIEIKFVKYYLAEVMTILLDEHVDKEICLSILKKIESADVELSEKMSYLLNQEPDPESPALKSA